MIPVDISGNWEFNPKVKIKVPRISMPSPNPSLRLAGDFATAQSSMCLRRYEIQPRPLWISELELWLTDSTGLLFFSMGVLLRWLLLSFRRKLFSHDKIWSSLRTWLQNFFQKKTHLCHNMGSSSECLPYSNFGSSRIKQPHLAFCPAFPASAPPKHLLLHPFCFHVSHPSSPYFSLKYG